MQWFRNLRDRISLSRLSDDSIHLCYPEYEIIEVSINGQFIPPGNVSEIVIPRNCLAMQGIFNGKWHMIYIYGMVKIVVMPMGEMKMNGMDEVKNDGGKEKSK